MIINHRQAKFQVGTTAEELLVALDPLRGCFDSDERRLAAAVQKFLLAKSWPVTEEGQVLIPWWRKFVVANTETWNDISNSPSGTPIASNAIIWKGAKLFLLHETNEHHQESACFYQLISGRWPSDPDFIAIADQKVPGPSDLNQGYKRVGLVTKDRTKAIVKVWRLSPNCSSESDCAQLRR